MRGVFVVLLLTLAAILSIGSNIGLWIERTVYDTDTFVDTTDQILEDEDVQQVVADRFTEELFVAADVESRLETELPEGLQFLALPLGIAARDFLRDATVRLLERQPFEDVRNEALRQTHTQLLNIIEDDSGAVETGGDELVINLRPILENVAEDVAGRDVNIPESGGAEDGEAIPEDLLNQLPDDVRERLERNDGLVDNIEIPEDAGTLVIEDRAVAWAYRIARYGDDAVYALIGITLLCYGVAVLVARRKRETLRNAALVFAVAGIVSLALLLPVGQAVRMYAENDDAATSVVDIITSGYKEQSLAMIFIGVAIAGGAVLAGDSRAAVSIRSWFRKTDNAPAITEVARERVNVLRVAGLLCAALVIIVWPDPTARVYVTTLALLALYLGALWVMTSDSPNAVSVRERWDRFRADQARNGREGGGGSARSWVHAHTGWLRIAGVAGAVVLLALWPSVSMRTVVMVIALLLIYLALVDMAGTSAEEQAEREPEPQGEPRARGEPQPR